jgi:aspartate kinase
MSRTPVVVKLGGDALHSPERIGAAARRVAGLAQHEPVIAVVSARRGVTDHLLGLVDDVRSVIGGAARAHPEADRAVAAGEVVTAALLALALEALGVSAVSLDAREAGLRAGGNPGRATLRRVEAGRLRAVLARGVVPVVTGFQGWRQGRVTTLGRGGTDITAVALAAALRARRVILVKDAPGLRTADPKLVPDSRPIPRAPHRFLTALAAAGARVIRTKAAQLAERYGVALEFHSLEGEQPLTEIARDLPGDGVRAVTLGPPAQGRIPVTAVFANPTERDKLTEPLEQRLAAGSIVSIEDGAAVGGLRLLVPEANAHDTLRALHRVLTGPSAPPLARAPGTIALTAGAGR